MWCWRRVLRIPFTAKRSNQSILKEISSEYSLEGLMLKLKLNTLATWWEEQTHWKRPWCWERLKVGGEVDNRGWDGWMVLLIHWTWIWACSGSWWLTGKPGLLLFMGSQRMGDDWVTELNWIEPNSMSTLKTEKMEWFELLEEHYASLLAQRPWGKHWWGMKKASKSWKLSPCWSSTRKSGPLFSNPRKSDKFKSASTLWSPDKNSIQFSSVTVRRAICFINSTNLMFISSQTLFARRVVSSAYLRLLIFLLEILIPACASSSQAFLMMYSVYKLNKQGDNIQPWYTPFPLWNQSVVPCPVLTVASWPAYRFLKRQVRWSGIANSFRTFHNLLWSTQSKTGHSQ